MSAFLPAPSTMVVFSFSMTHLLGAAEHRDGHVLELDAEIFGDQLAAGEDRDVLEHRLAAIAEARRLHRRDLEAAAQLVDHERRERFAFDVLGNDQQRLARLHHRFEHRQHRLQAGELLLVEQDVGVLKLGDHLLGIGDEVGREVAAVELHALDDRRPRCRAILASSTVITPSLPTFCIAWAIILPILLSPLDEMVPTWATSADRARPSWRASRCPRPRPRRQYRCRA